MPELTAVDVLVLPDEESAQRLHALNRRLRAGHPEGYALDRTHAAHVSLLHRYVHSAEIEPVLEACGRVLTGWGPGVPAFEATGVYDIDWSGQPLVSVRLEGEPRVLDLQAALVEALAPYSGSGGTAVAFVTDPEQPDISPATMEYVERFVPDQVGHGRYVPHVTVGFGAPEEVARLEEEPFDRYPVRGVAIGCYQLGEGGTARRELRRWPLG